MIHPLDCDGA